MSAKFRIIWFAVATVDGQDLDWWGPFDTEQEAIDTGHNAGADAQAVAFKLVWEPA